MGHMGRGKSGAILKDFAAEKERPNKAAPPITNAARAARPPDLGREAQHRVDG
jgi:hypothetical protein